MRVGPQRMIATTGDHPQSLRDSPRQRGERYRRYATAIRALQLGTAFGRSPLAHLSDRLRLQTALPFAQPAAK